MKGIIISLIVFICYSILTIILFHIFKPTRRLRIFLIIIPPSLLIYLVVFILTPNNLWFLPKMWMSESITLDLAYGSIVFLLNCHSFIDVFFGLNGGFSTSLMLEIYRSKDKGIKTEDITRAYIRPNNINTVFNRRIMMLQQSGYIKIDSNKKTYKLTNKGRVIAIIVYSLHRVLNLKN